MKTCPYILFPFISFLMPWCAMAIEVGDTPDQVREELGAPNGSMLTGALEVWMYPQGRVVFEEQAVSSFELISQEAFQEQEERRAQRAETQAQQDLLDSQQRRAEGLALLERMRSEAAFEKGSPERKLAWWLNFQARYPEVSVQTEIEALRFAAAEARAERQRLITEQQRIAALEQRVAEAEQKAADAERRAERYSNYYGYASYPAYAVTPVRNYYYASPVPVVRSVPNQDPQPEKKTDGKIIVNGFSRFGAK